MVGILWLFSSGTVASSIRWTATSGFVVPVVTSSGGGYLSDSVFNPHGVGVFRKLGNDFARAYPLSLMHYRSDRHKALFGGSVHSVGDLVEGLCEIPDGEGFAETSAPFVRFLLRSRRAFLSSLV
jgi:hypothetical protein